MKPFPPKTELTLFLRIDFADDDAWEALCIAAQEPDDEEGFHAYIDCVSDPAFANLPVAQVVAQAKGTHSTVLVADREALTHAERPILVVDVKTARTFRVIPSQLWGVENNLAIANMDWESFADNVDADGVFRGFA